jgi:hypothetical protein
VPACAFTSSSHVLTLCLVVMLPMSSVCRLGGIPASASSFRRALQKGSVGLVPGAQQTRLWGHPGPWQQLYLLAALVGLLVAVAQAPSSSICPVYGATSFGHMGLSGVENAWQMRELPLVGE